MSLIPREKLRKKSCITVAIDADYTCTSSNFEIIQFENITNNIGTGFSLTEGKILCNKDMKVMCIGNIAIKSIATAGGKELQIRYNSSTAKSYSIVYIDSGYKTINSTSHTFHVNKGDTIDIRYKGVANDVILGVQNYTTYLNVIEL